MKKLLTFITLSITSVSLQTSALRAQDGPPPGGNFDPEQMRQHMFEHLRQQFDVKDDSEWTLISNRVAKVMEARRAAGAEEARLAAEAELEREAAAAAEHAEPAITPEEPQPALVSEPAADAGREELPIYRWFGGK